MHDWNVVASTAQGGMRKILPVLKELARVSMTDYYNVLVLKTDDIDSFMQRLQTCWEINPDLHRYLGRAVPVEKSFLFQTPQEFEYKAQQSVLAWLPALAHTKFHVRMHRRGFHGRLSSQHEELFLDHFILDQLQEMGTPAQMDFKDPDFIIDVETVGQNAGLSLWSKAQLQKYPFLKVD
jgi:tRNA(Ser,Leu) C12 N-acetylase TAN1